jgi:hypothetical protein
MSRWPLVSAYLNGCGVGGGVLYSWWDLWSTTRSVHLRLQNCPTDSADDSWYWEQVRHHWQRALEGLRTPDPMLIRLRQVNTLKELGVSLAALAGRTGADSVRRVEADTGIPKTTLHAWFTGKRKPDPARLNKVVLSLGATKAEQKEFADALTRATSATCPSTACSLGELHKGPHRTPDGHEWFDDEEPDMTRPSHRWFEPHIPTAGPHW